ncbi:MAG: hypothetical protein H0X66_04520 [Verrucomicrobia bacterium]|nr:hypothetical protein [Verrucomicrobiota bacterium]
MNEPNQPQFPPPPPIISPQANETVNVLGQNPEERIPIHGVIGAIEAMLRNPRRVLFQLGQSGSGAVTFALVLIAIVCSLVYGVVIGTFSGGDQLWAAPLKVCLGLFIAALICLPSLYIFACLSGSQARLVEIAGMVAGLLALMTVLLIGFAPVAWVFSQSTESIAWMGALHLVFALIALFFGFRFLQSGFVHSAAKSTIGFKMWTVVFLLVILQMSTALRPFVGTAETFLPTQKKFFLAHWEESMKKPKIVEASSEPSTRY